MEHGDKPPVQSGLHRGDGGRSPRVRSTWLSPTRRSTSATITTSTTTGAPPRLPQLDEAVGRGVVRALKPDGTFWLAIGDEFAAELKILFHRELGLTLRSWVIWYYTFGVNCKRKFSRSHAHLFHFVKDPKNVHVQRRDIRVPSARQLVYVDARADPKGRLPDDTWILRPQDVPDGFHPRRTPGTSRASAARSRSAPAGTAARCPSSSWAASSAPARTPANWSSTPSAAAAPR